MRYLHRPHTFNDEIKSITSLLEGFDSCLELGGGWRKCNEPWETYELHPTCVMLYEDGGGGGEGGGVIAPAQGLWHTKHCLSVSNCGSNSLNATAGDKARTR